MTITTSVANDIRTVTMVFTGNNAKATQLLTDAARWNYEVKKRFQIFDEGLERDKNWDELTNPQKLMVIAQATQWHLVKDAKDFYVNTGLESAHQTVIDAGEAAYELI